MTSLLTRLSLRGKVLALCWTFMVPIAFLLYLTVSAYDKDLDFSQMEQKGDDFLRPAMALLADAAEHYTALRLSAFDPNASADAAAAAKAVDAGIETLRTTQAAIGEALQFTADGLKQRKRERSTIEVIAQEWGDFKNRAATQKDGAKITEAHRAMMADIRGMIAHAGDTSNLILDPDLDSYYVMDAVLLALPQNLDRLDQVEDFLLTTAAQGKVAAPEATRAAVHEAMLHEADVDRIAGDVQTAVAEDKNFYGTNPMVQEEFDAKLAVFKASSQPVLAGLLDLKGSAEILELAKAAHKMRIETRAFWDFSVKILDALLAKRVGVYQGKKHTALAVSLLLLILMTACSYVAVGRMARRLENYAGSVSNEAGSLAEVSGAMDSVTRDTAMASTQQSAAIEETVSSMEEMASMIAVTAQNAASTLTEAATARAEATHGKSVVAEMVASMSQISTANERLQSIVKVIDDIKTKTLIINDIAFETRLLAFNASIEAARAGAHGRGFAVVAEEVGKLANVSGKAADEVRSLLDGSVSQVDAILKETRSRVEYGQQTSHSCADAFEKMDATTAAISEGIGRIAAAAREQEEGVKQTNKAMQDMDRVAQSTASGGERAATQSTQLRNAATSLLSSASMMLNLVTGRKAAKLTTDRNHGPPGGGAGGPNELPSLSRPTLVKPALTAGSAQVTEPERSDSRWHAA